MTKFTETYKKMWTDNAELMKEFQAVHDLYTQDRATNSQAFNEVGKKVMEVLRDYENRLCSGMERGMYGKYSDKVAEKFWQRVKKDFPMIEMVGVEISKK